MSPIFFLYRAFFKYLLVDEVNILELKKVVLNALAAQEFAHCLTKDDRGQAHRDIAVVVEQHTLGVYIQE